MGIRAFLIGSRDITHVNGDNTTSQVDAPTKPPTPFLTPLPV